MKNIALGIALLSSASGAILLAFGNPFGILLLSLGILSAIANR